MRFKISLNFDGKFYEMQVKQVYQGDTIDPLEVSGGGKVVVVHTNNHYF
ncbi:hypothetical protein [Segetibacter koreensis]|nr:hypothetical protein [Segetibacter koreensis]